MPIGYTPLTSGAETALKSKEYDLNQSPIVRHETISKKTNRVANLTNPDGIASFQRLGMKDERTKRDTRSIIEGPNPMFNITTMINNEIKNKNFKSSLQSDSRNQQSLGNNDNR